MASYDPADDAEHRARFARATGVIGEYMGKAERYKRERDELAALAFEVCRRVDQCGLYGPADHLRDAAARLKAKAVEFTGEKK